MLSSKTIRAITRETLKYWKEEVTRPAFVELAQGKEIGHKLADMVDEKTGALLTVNHMITHEHNRQGEKRARSMGDLWLLDKHIYHPVNIKTGLVGSEGQPNLVSLKKVLSAVMQRQIDSYYLLMVKMRIHPDNIEPSVYFTDMLDWLEYTTFDSGPGQLMLKAKAFFAAFTPASTPAHDMKEKAETLMALYEDSEKRLRKNRRLDLKKYRQQFKSFLSNIDSGVTPETQRSLLLQ